jgi:hypothetical protein
VSASERIGRKPETIVPGSKGDRFAGVLGHRQAHLDTRVRRDRIAKRQPLGAHFGLQFFWGHAIHRAGFRRTIKLSPVIATRECAL